MMRLAAAVIREFPYWAHRRQDPTLAGRAVVVGALPSARSGVLARSPEARALGVRLGATVVAARALAPEAVFLPPDPLLYKRETDALVKRLETLSPRVEASADGLYTLDLRGLDRLHPTEEAFAERVRSLLAEAGYPASVGVASTRYAASVAALHAAQMFDEPTSTTHSKLTRRAPAVPGIAVVPVATEAAFLAPLPLSYLPVREEMLEHLTLLGLATLGDLARLSAAAIEARFGGEGLRLHRLAAGEDPVPLSPAAQRATPRTAIDLDAPVALYEQFAFALKRLSDGLLDDLARRGLAAAELALTLVLDDGSRAVRSTRPTRPTLSPRLALDLLRLAVTREPLQAPVKGLILEAPDTTPARAEQLKLYTRRRGQPEAVEGALARLRALLGPEGAVAPRLADTHRPEHQVRWEPYPGLPDKPDKLPELRVKDVGGFRGRLLGRLKKVHPQAALPPGPAVPQLPARLYDPPRPVVVRVAAGAPRYLETPGLAGFVTEARGPHRLEGEWWGNRYARDYFEVAVGPAGRYWIFHERGGAGGWFLQGAYD